MNLRRLSAGAVTVFGLLVVLAWPVSAQERRPEGSEHAEADLYRGRVYMFFRRGWTVPPSISREDAQGLRVTVEVTIGAERQIASFAIRTSSGNRRFDESVLHHLGRLKASDQRIPPPPPEIAAEFVDTTIVLRFSGRQAE